MNNKKLTSIIIAGIIVILLIFGMTKNNNAIYSYDGEKVDADGYYEILQEQYGTNFTYQFIEKQYLSTLDVEEDVLENIKETEEQLKEEASDDESLAILEATLRSFGYQGMDELNLYLRNSYLRNKIVEDNFHEYFKNKDEFIKEYKPRLVTHVLIRFDDEENDTSEDIEKHMAKIDEALNKSDNIKIDMIELGDGETIIGEDLGYVDKESQLVSEFLESALSLKKGEVSDWVKTDYGYHRIYIENTSEEDLVKNTDLITKVLETSPSISVEILLDKMMEDGVKINDALLNEIKEMAGL